jgi:hypothetical protein
VRPILLGIAVVLATLSAGSAIAAGAVIGSQWAAVGKAWLMCPAFAAQLFVFDCIKQLLLRCLAVHRAPISMWTMGYFYWLVLVIVLWVAEVLAAIKAPFPLPQDAIMLGLLAAMQLALVASSGLLPPLLIRHSSDVGAGIAPLGDLPAKSAQSMPITETARHHPPAPVAVAPAPVAPADGSQLGRMSADGDASGSTAATASDAMTKVRAVEAEGSDMALLVLSGLAGIFLKSAQEQIEGKPSSYELRLQSSCRRLARRFNCSPSSVHRGLIELMVRGLLRLKSTPRGTEVSISIATLRATLEALSNPSSGDAYLTLSRARFS